MKTYWVPEEALFDSAEECLTGLGGLGAATLVCTHEAIDALNDLTDCRAELKLSAKINSRLVEENKIMREAHEKIMHFNRYNNQRGTEYLISKDALEKCSPIKTTSEDT